MNEILFLVEGECGLDEGREATPREIPQKIIEEIVHAYTCGTRHRIQNCNKATCSFGDFESKLISDFVQTLPSCRR